MESGYPISRTYNNGNYGDYGRSYIFRELSGSYARSATWWELNLLLTQKIPVRTGSLFAIVQLENITNSRVGVSGFVSGDNRWIIAGRQSPIRITVAGRYDF